MTSYSGRHAELYDVFYSDKPYVTEAAFVDWCLKKYSNGASDHLLELACGTGTHAIELEKFGYQVVATDYSADMLSRAKQKAVERSSTIDFQLQDMTRLNLDGRTFDAAICLFDAIGYVGENEALEKVFHGVHKHVRPSGLFIFEFWHAGAMIPHFDPVRIRRWDNGNSEILRISETTLELARQLSHVKYSVFELNKNGTYTSFTETQTNRYFLLQEMAAWLTTTDFTPVKWFSGFADNETINSDTWHIVAVARRN